jgi:hypothetical protein
VAQRLPLLLGGAAVYRCGNGLVLNWALAAEGKALNQELLFPQVVKRCPDTNREFFGGVLIRPVPSARYDRSSQPRISLARQLQKGIL